MMKNQNMRRLGCAAAGRRMFIAAALSGLMTAPALAASATDHGDMKGMDHCNMPGMSPAPRKAAPVQKPTTKPDSMQDMDHSNMPGMQQEPMKGMDDGSIKDVQKSGDQGLRGGMDMGPMQGGKPPPDARDPDAYAEGLTYGRIRGMDMADGNLYGFLLLDKLEYVQKGTVRLDGEAWYGGDYDKLWLKADGDRTAGRLRATRTEALWDRMFATYWSTQLGVRHDFGDGPGRNWAALGVQGLARYWFAVEATAYVGPSGRTAARAELNYDLLLTQRVILQPNVEVNVYGKDDRARRIGSGVSDLEAGLRLRYEIKRQFAPYIGMSWRRKVGNTAELTRAAGEDVKDTQFVAGVRIWF
jgi:copper resistance protein B